MSTATSDAEDVKPETVESGEISGALIQSNGSNAAIMFDRIQDPMAFAGLVGKAFAASGMFGCKNLAQGQVLALACILEKRNPLELMRTYHIISGKLSMRSDAMLAEFRRRGGKVKWIKTGEDAQEARAKWSYDGNALEIGYTIAEAKRAGLLKSGGNWEKFPDAMLRARCISKAIRMMAPEIVAGCYAPEELGAGGNPESDIVEAECVPLENVEKTPAVDFATKTAAFVSPQPAPATAPASVVAESAPAPVAPIADVDVSEEVAPEMVTVDQLQAMKAYKVDRLQIPDAAWKGILAKRVNLQGRPVASAKELTRAQADELLGNLEKMWAEKRLKDGVNQGVDKLAQQIANSPRGGSDPMSRWANGETVIAEQPPFETAASGS